jgi:hypothetical protein
MNYLSCSTKEHYSKLLKDFDRDVLYHKQIN